MMAESIDTPCAAYSAAAKQWQRCRDAVAGTDAVKARAAIVASGSTNLQAYAGTAYLPALGGQTAPEYDAYKLRADFYNASARTLDGLTGLVFRKAPQITLPTNMDGLAKVLTPDGLALEQLAEVAVEDVVGVGRIGLLVDFPQAVESDAPITEAQAEALGRRPYVSVYKAEAILDWSVAVINGQRQLVRVVLQESATTIRELRLEGAYTVTIHTKTDSGWVANAPYTPLRNAKPLDFIPFAILAPKPGDMEPAKPPLLDLVDINLSHYRTSADLEHGAHFTALPTPYVTGQSDTTGELRIGSQTAWVIGDPQAKVGMLEFTGQGLQALEKRLEAKEAQMAALGARMLAGEKRAAEAAETASIHRSGENSVLASLANAVSRQLTKVLEWVRDWAGLTGDVSIALNTDYIPAAMTAQELTAWVAAVQSGRVSQQTFFEALQAGEMVRQDLTYEDEEERRAESAVTDQPTPTGGDDADGQ